MSDGGVRGGEGRERAPVFAPHLLKRIEPAIEGDGQPSDRITLGRVDVVPPLVWDEERIRRPERRQSAAASQRGDLLGRGPLEVHLCNRKEGSVGEGGGRG